MKLCGAGRLPKIHLSLPESGSDHANTHRITLAQKSNTVYNINVNPIGMGLKTISSFWVLNPTNKTYFWKMAQRETSNDSGGMTVQVFLS